MIIVEIENSHALASIALQGAHVLSFQTRQKPPLLWLSETALFERDKAIRGGIPICWPWFGPHDSDTSLPNHGFARTSRWELQALEGNPDGSDTLHFELRDNAASRSLWPHRFILRLSVTISTALTLRLSTLNCDDKPFDLTSALHTYFTISDIKNVHIDGLDNCRYYDQLSKSHCDQKGSVTFSRETDRVYFDTPEQLILHDTDQAILITQRGSRSTVVWNPWIEKTKGFSDMQSNAYRHMLCIETANAKEDMITLMPGDSHTLGATYASVVT